MLLDPNTERIIKRYIEPLHREIERLANEVEELKAKINTEDNVNNGVLDDVSSCKHSWIYKKHSLSMICSKCKEKRNIV